MIQLLFGALVVVRALTSGSTWPASWSAISEIMIVNHAPCFSETLCECYAGRWANPYFDFVLLCTLLYALCPWPFI